MTSPDAASLVLMFVVISGSTALIVLAAVVLARSRRGGTARLFGRAVYRPRLWASGATCGGVAGLLFEARELMPGSWQRPSLSILGVLQLAFFGLLFTYLFLQWRADRAGSNKAQSRP
ncbi:hypothetical protein O7635_35935 [Asanoa sp. WMMD1127]|uniref:hypothetical protein n=1 Tax=Asanoa sp. WMMD1127 TaxID=3016107 RepID=UPI002417678E|nr:hypothetical protein [Asanoa sp. WMMD1127]MDG4827267.1 hypothetical protein [Asanoa sp. WMMD1127]